MDNINIVRGLAIDRKPFELSGSGTASSSGAVIATVANAATLMPSSIDTLTKLKVNSTDTDDDSHYDGVKEKLVEEYTISGDPATSGTTTFTITSSASDAIVALLSIPIEGTYICPIASGDSASVIAGKIRAIDMSESDFTLSGEGVEVIVTRTATGNNIQTYLGANLEANEGGGDKFSFSIDVVDGTYEGGAKRAIYVDIPDGIEENSAGDITVYFSSATGTTVTLAENETVQTLVTKIAAQKPSADWSVSAIDIGEETYILQIRYNIAEVVDAPISIDYGTTGLNESENRLYIPGVDAEGGALIPGPINVYFNSATATVIQAEEGDEVADIYTKIAAATPTGYTASSTGNITIEKDIDGAQTIYLSIDLLDTGITKSSSILTKGTDSTSGTGARTVKLYCIGSGSTPSACYKTEIVSLNGQSQVETTGEYYFCYHSEVLTSGSSKKNEGVIYVGIGDLTSYVPTVVHSAIAANSSISEDAAFLVPSGQKGFIEKISVSNPSTTEILKIDIAYRGNGKVGLLRKDWNIVPGNTEIEFEYPLSIPGGTLVYPIVKSTSATAPVSISTSGLVVYS